ncbi:LacI family DNA-binding transcriptional regulator [Lentilactobacillus sunkii]|uniref:Transcriptional regulator, LacI family n=1 Tax=Lentilactobacillus sunkii DSM 19904 TaxID=1423808 RepID=A0A0R1LAP5_9LACO|nr:LacI family DNA-binding transcriptional regulator [Lentilactobacillus sunkii]KRK89442.1 transcriptional regulator, LacI family [Lentilactobacillus sunkii DSM 19904]
MMVKLQDVADTAGVSISTVSKILNNDTTLSVSETTRQRVLGVAKLLKYRRKSSQSPQRYAIISSIEIFRAKSDYHYQALRSMIETVATSMGITAQTVVFKSNTQPRLSGFDGILALGHFTDQQIQYLIDSEVPVVSVGENLFSSGIDSIISDLDTPVAQAIDHFRKTGQDDIGILARHENVKDSDGLDDPWTRAVLKHLRRGGIYSKDRIFCGSYGPEAGFDLMNQAIEACGDNLPHVFLVWDDSMAIGALRALKQSKIKVPQRVSLVGTDDIDIAKYTQPALSTIRVHNESMVEQALQMLFDHPKDQSLIPKLVIVGTKLIQRESSL